MATQIITTLIDSINGSTEDVETVTFFHPMTGQKMTIELDAKNRKAMGTHLERMSKYFDAAEIVEEVTPVKATKASADKSELAKIRAWAKDSGFIIGDRGRIKAEIVEGYHKAQAVGTVSDSEAEASVAYHKAQETPAKLESALENSAKGNVADLGDFTEYLDAEIVEQLEATDTVTENPQVDLSDESILAMMAAAEAESGKPVSLETLSAKVDSASASE
jgi:hypothetical protein